jgi:hypothetical protein
MLDQMLVSAALERQDLPRAYLAHHELETEFITIMIVVVSAEWSR